MIKLLYTPYTIANYQALSIEYITRCNLPLLPSQLLAIEKDMDYYQVYNDNLLIGCIVGYKLSTVWYAHRVLLTGRNTLYFSKVLQAVYNLAKSHNCTDIVLQPDIHTARMYDKHNIATRIT